MDVASPRWRLLEKLCLEGCHVREAVERARGLPREYPRDHAVTFAP